MIYPRQMQPILDNAIQWLTDENPRIRKELSEQCGKELFIKDFDIKMMDDEHFDQTVKRLSPSLQYRLKLMRSVEKAKVDLQTLVLAPSSCVKNA